MKSMRVASNPKQSHCVMDLGNLRRNCEVDRGGKALLSIGWKEEEVSRDE